MCVKSKTILGSVWLCLRHMELMLARTERASGFTNLLLSHTHSHVFITSEYIALTSIHVLWPQTKICPFVFFSLKGGQIPTMWQSKHNYVPDSDRQSACCPFEPQRKLTVWEEINVLPEATVTLTYSNNTSCLLYSFRQTVSRFMPVEEIIGSGEKKQMGGLGALGV